MWNKSDHRSTDPVTDITIKLSLWKRCNHHTRVWSELAPLSLVLQAAYSAVFEFRDGTAAGSSPMTPVPCQGFELIGRDAARFEIGLEAVLEPLEWSTNAACTIRLLSVQRLLSYFDILHTRASVSLAPVFGARALETGRTICHTLLQWILPQWVLPQ